MSQVDFHIDNDWFFFYTFCNYNVGNLEPRNQEYSQVNCSWENQIDALVLQDKGTWFRQTSSAFCWLFKRKKTWSEVADSQNTKICQS